MTRTRFLRDACSYMERFTDSETRNQSRGTDILSTLHDVAADLMAHPERRATLYLFSDMLQANSQLDFEKGERRPPADWVDRAAADGRLPDLSGLCVVVVGARTETDKSLAVRQFWTEYFDATGATLHGRNYMLRPTQLPALPCPELR